MDGNIIFLPHREKDFFSLWPGILSLPPLLCGGGESLRGFFFAPGSIGALPGVVGLAKAPASKRTPGVKFPPEYSGQSGPRNGVFFFFSQTHSPLVWPGEVSRGVFSPFFFLARRPPLVFSEPNPFLPPSFVGFLASPPRFFFGESRSGGGKRKRKSVGPPHVYKNPEKTPAWEAPRRGGAKKLPPRLTKCFLPHGEGGFPPPQQNIGPPTKRTPPPLNGAPPR